MKRWATLAKAVTRHGPCALVSVTSTRGSVPRGTDAWMIVTPEGFHGSIGGGTLEWKAMAEAQALLGKGAGSRCLNFVLGPDLGQCCGGRVTLQIEICDKSDLARIAEEAPAGHDEPRKLYLFGAGHVGRALVLALAPLPFDVIWIDPRPNAFPSVVPQNVSTLQPQDPASLPADAPHGSLTFIMSHSHTLDLAIVDAALRNTNIAHVGLIGSATKRARFERRLTEAGVDPLRVSNLICPIGIAGIASKHPAAIAAAVAAQALQLDSALQATAENHSRMTGSLN